MATFHKTALRAALLVCEEFAQGSSPASSVCFPDYTWDSMQRLRRQIRLAHDRGWYRAAGRLTQDLAGLVHRCRNDPEAAARVLQPVYLPPPAPSVSDVYQDLLALPDEFGDVELDLKACTIMQCPACPFRRQCQAWAG